MRSKAATRRLRIPKAVWVNLPMIYPQMNFPPQLFRPDDGTLNVRGEVAGELVGWARITTGEWLGLVSFRVPYATLVVSTGLPLEEQLVPAHALRRESVVLGLASGLFPRSFPGGARYADVALLLPSRGLGGVRAPCRNGGVPRAGLVPS
jgi:hypothetical protein